jgi:hypothetical protein
MSPGPERSGEQRHLAPIRYQIFRREFKTPTFRHRSAGGALDAENPFDTA